MVNIQNCGAVLI